MSAPLPCELARRRELTVADPLFVADLHLAPWRPAVNRAFFRFLRENAARRRELFILGDLFEFWLGDDLAAPARSVSRALRLLTEGGVRLFLLHGNRDFLLGEKWLESCGAELLAPGSVAVGPVGQRILLSHGDEWCLLDEEYQRVRDMFRSPAWQRAALSMSPLARLRFALRARRRSRGRKRAKSAAEMDVVTAAARRAAEAADCHWVIHGHTHRPAEHRDGELTRLVLPDWGAAGGTTRGGWAELDAAGRPTLIIASP